MSINIYDNGNIRTVAGYETDMIATTTLPGVVMPDGVTIDINTTTGGIKVVADQLEYDNSTSGLTSSTLQTAIDEVDSNVDDLANAYDKVEMVSSLPANPDTRTLYLVTG